jgi:hypothetical protein
MIPNMDSNSDMTPVEWVRRVNRTWLVHGGLDQAAEEWLDHLQATDPPRLEAACVAARALCGMRQPLADPKPWFYAGLFHVATADEAARFIPGHRITLATVPAMLRDPEVDSWLDGMGQETRDLVHALRDGIERLGAVNRDA